MGSCFSSASFADNLQNPINCADVVSFTGDLHHYPIPVTVSQVLESEETISSSTTIDNLFFLCNSDCLYFDDYIPALAPHHQLQPSHLYFLLPLSKLRSRLTASDMAALAVKAGLALQMTSCSSCRRDFHHHHHHHHKPRVSPQDHDANQPDPSHLLMITNSCTTNSTRKQKQKTQGLNSTRRRRAKHHKMPAAAVPSFMTTSLPTISEGSVLLLN